MSSLFPILPSPVYMSNPYHFLGFFYWRVLTLNHPKLTYQDTSGIGVLWLLIPSRTSILKHGEMLIFSLSSYGRKLLSPWALSLWVLSSFVFLWVHSHCSALRTGARAERMFSLPFTSSWRQAFSGLLTTLTYWVNYPNLLGRLSRGQSLDNLRALFLQ